MTEAPIRVVPQKFKAFVPAGYSYVAAGAEAFFDAYPAVVRGFASYTVPCPPGNGKNREENKYDS